MSNATAGAMTAPTIPVADPDVRPPRIAVPKGACDCHAHLFGPQQPHTTLEKRMPNDGDLLNLLEQWAPDAALHKRILVDNPAKLYGFN